MRLRGSAVLASPMLNRGTAFTLAERQALGLTGLLPEGVSTIEGQLALRRFHTPAPAGPDCGAGRLRDDMADDLDPAETREWVPRRRRDRRAGVARRHARRVRVQRNHQSRLPAELAQDKGQFLPDGMMPATVLTIEKFVGNVTGPVNLATTYTNQYAIAANKLEGFTR